VDVETLASWSQILGVVGGPATLIFVGFQIRDNSRAVRAATAQAVHDNYGMSAFHPMLPSAGPFSAKPGWENGMQSVGLVHCVRHNPGEVQL